MEAGARTILTAAILAGGSARRLGGADKSALTIGARSILDRQLAVLRELTDDIRIVAGDAGRFRHAGVPVVPDRIPGIGALGGLYTALYEASSEQVLVVACDMPFLTAPFLRRLVERAASRDGALPRDARGRHPLCAVYARRAAVHLEGRIAAGERRVLDAIADLDLYDMGPEELEAFDPAGRLLVNVNTRDDLASAHVYAHDTGS